MKERCSSREGWLSHCGYGPTLVCCAVLKQNMVGIDADRSRTHAMREKARMIPAMPNKISQTVSQLYHVLGVYLQVH